MKQKVLTVSKVTNYIKRIFDYDVILSNVLVEGEVSNFNLHRSGHAYFSIKDENSRLSCVMFRNAIKDTLLFKDGDQVVLTGRVSVYEKNGQYQLYVSSYEKKGVGNLYEKFEQRKKELEQEGWFDPKHKRKLPYLPKKIGLVTSPTGAAVRDMISVISRRFPHVEIKLFPVSVQGEKAAHQIAHAIYRLNELALVDVLIIGRGGGSIEELWAFNEKEVVDAVFDSTIPVISAVGHETDFTLSDFVADLRAPTPSAAAELVLPSYQDVKSALNQYKVILSRNAKIAFDRSKNRLEQSKRHVFFSNPEFYFMKERQTIDGLRVKLETAMQKEITRKKHRLTEYKVRMEGYDPKKILSRGFSVLQNEEGRILQSSHEVKIGERIQTVLSDGIIRSTVDGKEKKEDGTKL